MGKAKEAKRSSKKPEERQDEERGSDSEASASKVAFMTGSLSPVATPLANAKLSKKIIKTIKKAVKHKDVRRGVKEVVKSIRKGHKGLVIMAGDVSPIDVLSHVPVLCEDANIPYIFTLSKAELGLASSTKRPTCCLMISPKDSVDYKKYYDEVYQDAQNALALISY